MGFDPNSAGQPLVNVHKKTTQVNLWMVVGVSVFFLISALTVVWLSKRHGPDEQHSTPAEQNARP
jgi:hypothetical protein